MNKEIFRSNVLHLAVLVSFLLLLGSESRPQTVDQGQSEYQKALDAGKKLYESGEVKEAIIKLFEAQNLAREKTEAAEACFQISLCYYTLGDTENCLAFLRKVFENSLEKEIAAELFPPRFVGLFYQIKNEVRKTAAAKDAAKLQAEIEKPKAEPEKKPIEDRPPAGIGKGKQAVPAKKKSLLPWLIGGGVAVAGSVIALVVSKKGEPAAPEYGNINVASQPSGARVVLDGQDTGRTTNCLLTNISVGSHNLKLELANYGKWEGSVSVIGGQTANVTATLAGYLYEFVSSWGTQGSGDGQFSLPWGVAADRSGYIYVADAYNHRIQKFTSSGNFVAKWGSLGSGDGQFSYPCGIAVDASNNILVSSFHLIQKFTSNGSFLAKWGSQGSGDGQFFSPRGIAIDSTGNIYVSESGNNRIQKFTPSGSFIAKWGGPGNGDGQFNMLWNVAIDSSGYIYATDSNNHRIQKFTSNGVFAAKWGALGEDDGQFSFPLGIAMDATGYIFTSDGNRIQKFTSGGGFIAKWGNLGSGDGQFLHPYGIAVDSSGFVYVADRDNNRIQKFRMTTQTMAAARITYAPMRMKPFATRFNGPFTIFSLPARERSRVVPSVRPFEPPPKERIKEK